MLYVFLDPPILIAIQLYILSKRFEIYTLIINLFLFLIVFYFKNRFRGFQQQKSF